jgi:hypothetical protein
MGSATAVPAVGWLHCCSFWLSNCMPCRMITFRKLKSAANMVVSTQLVRIGEGLGAEYSQHVAIWPGYSRPGLCFAGVLASTRAFCLAQAIAQGSNQAFQIITSVISLEGCPHIERAIPCNERHFDMIFVV